MKIDFIGTGSMLSDNNPACFIVDEKILIDIPNGCHKIIRKNKYLPKIEHLLITHTHADHIFDIPFMLLSNYCEDRKLVIHTSRKNAKTIMKIIKLGFPGKYYEFLMSGLFSFDYREEFLVDDKIVKRFRVKHGIMDAYGYKITNETSSIVFTGDSCFGNHITKQLDDAKALVCDCTYAKSIDKHMGADNIEYFLNNYPTLKVIPIHNNRNSLKPLKEINNANLLLVDDLSSIIID